MSIFSELKPFLREQNHGQVRRSGLVLALIMISVAAGLCPAFLIRILFDRAVPNHDLKIIAPVALLIILSEGAGMYCRYRTEFHLAEMSQASRLAERRRQSVLIWNRKVPWFNRSGAGTVIRLYDDAAVLGDLHSRFLRQIVGPAMAVLVLLPFMFLIDPLLASVRIALILPAVLPGAHFREKDLQLEKGLWKESRILATLQAQAAQGAADMFARHRRMSLVSHIRSRYFRLGTIEVNRRKLVARWEARAAGIPHLGNSLSPVLAVWLILSGQLSFGSYIAFSIIAARCIGAVGELLGGFRTMTRAGNAIARRSVLETSCRQSQAEFIGSNDGRFPGLQISELRFSYHNKSSAYSGTSLLEDLSITVRKGEWVRLGGENGSGKSTLINLIFGFLAPHSGTIRWDGWSLPDCPGSNLSRLISGISQNPAFFSGTVRENLTLFGPSPSDRRLWKVLEQARADSIVRNIPSGLDGVLGGTGGNLSGGERQRLATARLLLYPTPLVLLDEPFSSLDSQGARDVAESLGKACQGKTVVLIHHGKDCPLAVDRELTLSKGMIR